MSCLLHGSLAFGAVLFVQRMELAPQAEPFKWNVALIASSSKVAPPEAETSAPPSQKKTASTPAHEQPASSARAGRSSPNPIRASVETPAPPPSLVAPAAEKPASATPPLPPPPIAELAPKPVHDQTPVPNAIEAPDQLIKQDESIEPSAPSVVPSTHHLQTSSSVQSPDLPATPPNDSTPTEPATPSPTLDPPSRHASTTATEQVPPVHSEHPAVIKEGSSPSPPTATSGTQVAALAPAGQPKPSKIDYGWLADLMAGWIQELNKRYPAVLRTEGIQGRVTLTALLHDDGKLSDVRVAKSSGNAMLDQVAVEDVTKGPPVTLSRPLERPHMSVKFSIIYALKTAR